MAIGLMTVLKLVPWGEVIKNAPAVADGARKLWDSVGQSKKAAPKVQARLDDSNRLDGGDAQAQRWQAAQAEIGALQEQMQASSALIKALAEQNAELVQRVETHRSRLLWLAAVLAVFASIAGLNLAVTLSR